MTKNIKKSFKKGDKLNFRLDPYKGIKGKVKKFEIVGKLSYTGEWALAPKNKNDDRVMTYTDNDLIELQEKGEIVFDKEYQPVYNTGKNNMFEKKVKELLK